MDDAIVLYDYDQEKILDCNKSAVKLLGYTKSEMLQLNRFDIMSDRSRFYPGINIHNEIRTRHRKMIYDGECIDSMGEVISKTRYTTFGKNKCDPGWREILSGVCNC